MYKYDISLPVSRMYDLVDLMKARLGSKVDGVVGYGHLGDGNLHLNIHAKKYSDEILGLIEPYVFDQTGQTRQRTCEQAWDRFEECIGLLARLLTTYLCPFFLSSPSLISPL